MAGIVRRPRVDAVVGGELRRVDRKQSAVTVRELGNLVDRRDEAGHIGRPAHRDQPDPSFVGAQLALDGVEVHMAVIRQPDDDVAAAVAPRQEVGVVLHLGDQDLAAVQACVLGRDAIQGVRGALDEDGDLRALVEVQEAGHQLPRVLVGLGGEA